MRLSLPLRAALLLALPLAWGCGGGGNNGGGDGDGDGFSIDDGDCNDTNAAVNPDATEVCDSVDNNCNGLIDEGFDADADGFSSCGGDCNDNDAAIRPGAIEQANGADDDCDGFIDDGVDDPNLDDDGDGFTNAAGDCNDAEPLVNPDAVETPDDNVDNNCDGQVNEPLPVCDQNANPLDPFSFAAAVGLCTGVSNVTLTGSTVGRAIAGNFGSNTATLNVPIEGTKLVVLSSGSANQNTHDPGTQYDNNGNRLTCTSSPHPLQQNTPPAGGCGDVDPAAVCDFNEIRLDINIPTNAESFSYNFQFYSSEYPTFRCTEFNDTFLALATVRDAAGNVVFDGNISFDANGNEVSINNGFMQVCFDDNPNVNGGPPNDCTDDPTATLGTTGFAADNDANNDGIPNAGANSIGAGATKTLVTTAPAAPGGTMTLRFVIFDEGDDILDSTVLIDNFRWLATPVDDPVTEIP
jgi:hypothetical protein